MPVHVCGPAVVAGKSGVSPVRQAASRQTVTAAAAIACPTRGATSRLIPGIAPIIVQARSPAAPEDAPQAVSTATPKTATGTIRIPDRRTQAAPRLHV
ncbi:hypothetical protein GCM10017786_73480 [Amycolatopsis deserti]|uniref:Uncharacterized protein n=1 Tax=Amycolatopsis deserti TaxID=185696 RepID=A0ABQ3JLT2_9PSEU|nr:hypothetical protein GCM10017786_73480 [Amycolatopsis deserti]